MLGILGYDSNPVRLGMSVDMRADVVARAIKGQGLIEGC